MQFVTRNIVPCKASHLKWTLLPVDILFSNYVENHPQSWLHNYPCYPFCFMFDLGFE